MDYSINDIPELEQRTIWLKSELEKLEHALFVYQNEKHKIKEKFMFLSCFNEFSLKQEIDKLSDDLLETFKIIYCLTKQEQ